MADPRRTTVLCPRCVSLGTVGRHTMHWCANHINDGECMVRHEEWRGQGGWLARGHWYNLGEHLLEPDVEGAYRAGLRLALVAGLVDKVVADACLSGVGDG